MKRYRVTLSSNTIYTEIELASDMQQVKVGTRIDSDVRLHKELFFGDVELFFVKKGEDWTVRCSDNLYLNVGDIRKLMSKNLSHGDAIEVKYQDSGIEVFTLSFALDFDYESRKYNLEIDVSKKGNIIIGGGVNADIAIFDDNIGTDRLALKIDGDTVLVIDDNSRYGVFVNGSRISKQKPISDGDFFSIANFSFYYKGGKLYTDESRNVQLNGLESQSLNQQSTHLTYPNYTRNTRIEYCLPEAEIEIKQPIPKPQKNKKNLILSLIPSIVMLILMVVMRGILGGGGTFVIYSVCSMGIGIVMSIVTYFYDGNEHKRAQERREREYREYIHQKEQTIISARNNELRIRNLIYESLNDSIQEVLMFGKRLFEKSSHDKDFLDIYLGTGTVEAMVPVKYTQQDFIDIEDTIAQLPAEIEQKYHYINNAPIISHFNLSNGVGVVGTRPSLYSIMKNITLDLAIRHFYKEIKMYYVFDESDCKSMEWVRWIRHTYNDEIGIRNFLCDDESRKILLENLYSVLSAREIAKQENDALEFNTYYVVFVLDSSPIRKHPVSKYIENCNRYGFTFVFFEEYEELLPRGCTEVIRLDSNQTNGILLESNNGDILTEFTYKGISDTLAELVALRLGAITVEEVSLESELTQSISMYDLLNIFSVDDLDLKKRWESSQVFKSMAAPLGVKTKNEVVYLDISDKASAHGPHGLVAGTTGSGKSEILQTYVLSMATLFHPYDVGFVIIDFKGGGMANQFKNLPHMMGAITNIDGREINRSLLSIKAELVKRQSFFAQAGVNHINDYIKLYKKGIVKQPLPHLIIIVDEFAELKSEFPDFMKELISAARIGRTLGVHLILATQKPAGVVDAQIWSNSKFKLCLKVQTKEDSNEVIKSPLAAEIVEPGRAYFQVGNNEIFELFQSAYSGVKVADDGDDKAKAFAIYALNSWGKKEIVYTNKKKNRTENAKTQLQVIVDYVEDYCRSSSIAALSGICLPPLADTIKKETLFSFTRPTQGISVPIGIYDDPEHQDQGNYCVELSENNTYIIGSAMTGKTTLLQTILLQLMSYYTPNDVNVYIIDCGNMTLKVFEGSNIVGGVVLTAEEDKIANLFKLLFRTMNERKKAFSKKGLGTHRAYVEAGYSDMPQIILMIDNIAAFKEYYDNLSDDFLALSREGNSLGISIVATASQTNAMNYKALSNYGTRISFVCNDSNEYMNLFDRCRMEPKDTAGRGLCVIDKRIVEFQTALCVEGDKEYIRVENIKTAIVKANHQYESLHALPIPVVPDIISFKNAKENKELYTSAYRIPMGIQYSTVQYAMLDLQTMGLIATLGREKSGRTNFVKHMMAAIQANIFNSVTEAYVVDNPARTLQSVKDYGYVEKYTADITELGSIVAYLEKALVERQERTAECDGYSIDEEPLLLLVIENDRLFEYLQTNKDVSTQIVQLLKKYRKYKFAIILSEIDNANVPFNAPEFMKFIKENKRFIFFDDIGNMKFFDVTAKQQKENSKPLKQGDAFVSFNGDIERIKTILYEEE